MSAQSTPVGMDISASATKRNNMVSHSMNRLQHLAWRAANMHALRSDQFVVVCIEVDSHWRDIVDMLMPHVTEAVWQEFRENGEVPIARGTASFGLCELLAERLPDIKNVLLEKPPEDSVKCIALNNGGATVYEIKPKEEEASLESTL